MKLSISIIAVTFVALVSITSGCSTISTSTDSAVSSSEKNCKVSLAQPARINYDARKETDLDKAEARAKLANSQYRLAQLNKPSGMNGTIEEALRDCY